MADWIQWLLIAAGIGLIVFLGKQIVQLSQRLRADRLSRDRNAQFRSRRREDMIQSLKVIIMGIQQDQIELSEACLRIKGLLDHLAPALLDREPYQVFQTVNDRLAHMPTHGARERTDKRFVFRMDRERFAIEEQYRDQILEAADQLKSERFTDKGDQQKH